MIGRPEAQFETAIRSIYDQCAEFGYYPTYLLQLIAEQGGKGAASALLRKPPSDGFARLALEQRLDLSVEALVLQPAWRNLFDADELRTARGRLRGTPHAGPPI